ncbi:SusD family protein [compost metagenome]
MYTLSDAHVKPEHTSSKEKFLEFIQNERMREFCFELSRKADLLRWGIFLSVNQDMANRIAKDSPTGWYRSTYGNVSSKDLLMPIPTNEITVNTAMVQNRGWD